MATQPIQRRFARVLAYIDQQVKETQAQLQQPATDEEARMNVEQLSSLQATRRYIERRLESGRVDRI
jgi:hypothetical protein